MKPPLWPVQIILCEAGARILALTARALSPVAETCVPHTTHRHTTSEQISFSINDIPVLFDFMGRAFPTHQALIKERRPRRRARLIRAGRFHLVSVGRGIENADVTI